MVLFKEARCFQMCRNRGGQLFSFVIKASCRFLLKHPSDGSGVSALLANSSTESLAWILYVLGSFC